MRKWILIVLGLLLMSICLPFIINYLILKPQLCEIVGSGADWLLFWGSYMGSILSAIAAFVILAVQYKQNKDENKNNRDVQKDILKYQIRSQWIADLKTKFIEYNESFDIIKIHEIAELIKRNDPRDKDYCISQLDRIWAKKDYATRHIQMMYYEKTDDFQNKLIKYLDEYDKAFYHILSDLTWYCKRIAFLDYNDTYDTLYVKDQINLLKTSETKFGEYPIIKVIEKHKCNIASKNTDIINDRMSELRDFNSSKLWGIIKTLVAYEQKLIDKIIEDNTHK